MINWTTILSIILVLTGLVVYKFRAKVFSGKATNTRLLRTFLPLMAIFVFLDDLIEVMLETQAPVKIIVLVILHDIS